MRANTSRQSEIRRLRTRLADEGHPRLKMSLIVVLTGGVGFLASWLMLRLGINAMPIRYLAAVGIAYLAFLLFLGLWLRTRQEDYAGISDAPGIPSSSCDGQIACHAADAADGGTVVEAIGGIAQAEEFAIPLFLLLAVIATLCSSLWVIYTAPSLFAELMIDGVLTATLYQKMRGMESRHWLSTAVRRTIWPFLLTAVVLAACGEGMHYFYPEARSLGEVLKSRRTTQQKPAQNRPEAILMVSASTVVLKA